MDDKLDLVNTQSELRNIFSEQLTAAELRQPVEQQGEIITERVARGLQSRPAFAQVLYTSS